MFLSFLPELISVSSSLSDLWFEDRILQVYCSIGSELLGPFLC